MADPEGPVYRAEVIAEIVAEAQQGKEEGTGAAQLVLGRFNTPYAGRALRWTCVQASRIANGLDPDPDVPWSTALTCIDPNDWLDLGDVPTQLRNWVADEEGRVAVYRRLRDGDSFTLTASDWSGRYVLVVRTVEPGADTDTAALSRPDDARVG
ncbi:hypothetical protein [Streptomyces sp. NPDC059256]|uniref:hypothetical protein n=1 Tax=Streptomyces sp. NPDC059256 TaxID=3346794 RepID=UPI003686E3DF